VQTVFLLQLEQKKSGIYSSPKNLYKQSSRSTGVPFSTFDGTGAYNVSCYTLLVEYFTPPHS